MSATQEPKIWFVLLNGKQHGPYSFAALVQAAKSGRLDLDDGVCRLGWGEWRLARDVPELFKPDPEPVAVDQEQDVEEYTGHLEQFDDLAKDNLNKKDDRAAVDQQQDVEEYTGDLEQFDDLAKDNPDKKDERDAARKPSADAFMASKPLIDHGRFYETFIRAQDAAIEADAGPSLGLTAGPSTSVSTPSAGSKTKSRSSDVWIVVFSVVAVLVAVFGAGWAATSLGMIRVTLSF
jgi:hypothetical protein